MKNATVKIVPKEAPVIHSNDNEDFVGPEELQQLHCQLEELLTHHHNALDQESAIDDVNKLQRWVSECQEGSAKAERKLYTRGVDLLTNVKSKLSLAMEEQQRIVEESPTASVTAKGRDAERYAKATSQANDALVKLTEITHAEHGDTPLPK